MDGTLYTLVTLVLLGAFLFMAYQFYVGVEKSNILYLGPGNKKKIVSGKNAQPSIYANEYSFSTFIYIDNDTHNGSTDPIIFYKGKPENKHLDVKLDKSVNKFIVTYNGQDCSVEMIPIGDAPSCREAVDIAVKSNNDMWNLEYARVCQTAAEKATESNRLSGLLEKQGVSFQTKCEDYDAQIQNQHENIKTLESLIQEWEELE